MPGVLSSNYHCGFSREVGKMAFLVHPDLMTLTGNVLNDSGDITDCLFDSSSQFFLDSADSDSDLPDNEHTVDLIKFLDSPDLDLEHRLHKHKCGEGCNTCANKYSRYSVSSRQDPFMGMGSSVEHFEENARPSTSVSTLGHLVMPVDYDSGSEDVTRQKVQETKTFSAWNTPKTEEEPDFMVFDDETSDMTFPDTPSPSARSGTNTGDDSDVDIETITDAPRSADSCGYVTQDSSPAISPSTSPEPIRKFHSSGLSVIKAKSVAALARSGTHMSALLSIRSRTSQNMLRVSSSTSLAENVASRSSLLGQKRKLSKDRKISYKAHSQPAHSHVLCNSNSVNFHDYAMSPGACVYPTCTETGRPTVLSKRIYRRHVTVDASGKEKQHHHNQLERNRRQKLADLFVDLRDEVPKIASQAKASKVLILKEATLYIRDLQKWDKQQEDDISKEQRKKELLRNQLRHLQAQISSHCVK